MMDIPRTHPRYQSLRYRELIAKGVEEGLVTPTGLTAHGRGEAFDYLLGERSITTALDQARVAAASMLLSTSPVISVNGNSTVLAPRETVELAKVVNARIEVNLFHPSNERVCKLVKHLEENGAVGVLGMSRDAIIPGLEHHRAHCTREGIYMADTVLVLLEDGDRTHALKKMGKNVIAVDLNPLSRTARECDVPIIDNVIRALPNITSSALNMSYLSHQELRRLVEEFDPGSSLKRVKDTIVEHLEKELDIAMGKM